MEILERLAREYSESDTYSEFRLMSREASSSKKKMKTSLRYKVPRQEVAPGGLQCETSVAASDCHHVAAGAPAPISKDDACPVLLLILKKKMKKKMKKEKKGRRRRGRRRGGTSRATAYALTASASKASLTFYNN